MVRIYLTEKKAHVDRLVEHLHDIEKLDGLTVFRAVAGFGSSGRVHSSSLIDLARDLPLVVEFFASPERAQTIIDEIRTWLPPCRIVSWTVREDVTPEDAAQPPRDF
jgi:hypothetical protein